MKVVAAILFSLALIGTAFRSDTATSCGNPTPRACCHGALKMSCCDTHPGSQPLPAVPATHPTPLNPSAIFAVAATWTLPDHPSVAISSDSLLPIAGASLYARHCALLL